MSVVVKSKLIPKLARDQCASNSRVMVSVSLFQDINLKEINPNIVVFNPKQLYKTPASSLNAPLANIPGTLVMIPGNERTVVNRHKVPSVPIVSAEVPLILKSESVPENIEDKFPPHTM